MVILYRVTVLCVAIHYISEEVRTVAEKRNICLKSEKNYPGMCGGKERVNIECVLHILLPEYVTGLFDSGLVGNGPTE